MCGDDAPRTYVRYEMLGLLAATAVAAYFCRGAAGVAESTIRQDLGLSETSMGWFMGTFYCTYALLGVPGGALGSAWGTRRTSALFLALCSLATALVGTATSLATLIAAQLLMGAAQAGLFPCAVSSISHWMPPARRALACGILGAGMQIGAFLSASCTGFLLNANVSWRSVFWLYSAPGIVLALVFYALFRDRPRNSKRISPAELALLGAALDAAPAHDVQAPRTPASWKAILQSRSVHWLCLQHMCRATGFVFFASWYPTFLQETRHVSKLESGVYQSLIPLATLCGTLAGGTVVDAIFKRTGSLWWSRSCVAGLLMFACGGLLLAAYSTPNVSLFVGLVTAASFAAAVGGPCGYVASIDVGGPQAPQVFALMNSMGSFAGFLCPIVVGKFFAQSADWNPVLLGIVAVYFCASIAWLLVDGSRSVTAPATAGGGGEGK